jgi:hypothetical protein
MRKKEMRMRRSICVLEPLLTKREKAGVRHLSRDVVGHEIFCGRYLAYLAYLRSSTETAAGQ